MWQEKVKLLEKQYSDLDAKRSTEVEELQSEVADLMRHLEVQCAVESSEQGVKDVCNFHQET